MHSLTKTAHKSLTRHRCFLSLILTTVAVTGVALVARAEDKPVQLERFVVSEKHQLSFGMAITLWEDKNTGRVLAMYVKQVQPDSMTEQLGIRPGTRIWTIDGVPVENFDATFDVASELGQKFVNRQRGASIVREFKVEGERKSQFVRLIQSPLTITVREPPPKP